MHATTLPITGPCPIDLDAIGFDRAAKVAHCSHCAKNVTVLSNLTRGEARAFLREHKGQTMCVSYARDAAGQIRFRPEPEPMPEPALIPVTRLRARPSRRAGLVVALGVGTALAACAPHGEPPRPVPIVVAKPIPEPPRPIVHETVLDPIPMAGAAMIPEEVVEIEGEIAVPDLDLIDEPCDSAKPEDGRATKAGRTLQRL